MTTFSQYRDSMLSKKAVKLDTEVKSTAGLAAAISLEMKSAGRAEVEYDIQKNMEHKATAMGMLETKANEIMHTGNTGYGAELVPGNVLMTDFLDMAPAASPLLSLFLAGYHGKNLDLKADLSVIGELPLHVLAPEQTTGAFAFAQGLGKNPTAKVTIQQKERWFTVDTSEAEAQFAIVDVVALIKRKLAVSAANTIVSDIINGDTVTAATTNINLIDGTPGGTESYLGADGLRKTAIAAGASQSFDAGTFDFSDYLTLLKALGVNASNRQDVAFIHSVGAEIAALGVTEFKQAYLNGINSSAMTGRIPSILGANLYIDRWLTEANAAGKISATPANNVKGQILAVNKYAVQHGSSGDYNLEIYRVPGKGYQIIGWYFYGHAIADKLAGTAPTVSHLYNIS